MASFTHRSNGRWQARIVIGKDENGKTLTKYLTRDSLRECKQAVSEIEQRKVTM
ncbi:hypothetical protein DEAC_c13810 [Desulfosporosinus acididurans]|uniref:AP2-like integrase N-terminal domain-containing protein n=1 Tax=Desulfosporosinus acididurans TaxID=476652 RepID=A0A0J1FUP4_9FIRM|nr:hypothetical protein [Desulfosporosinus acididurans]KLU66713.1 hypothetical protein DEAC_c13810 [Desulfosporosinus acididurans]